MKLNYTVIDVDGRETPGSIEAGDVGSREAYEAIRRLCKEHIAGDREHVRVFWKGKYTSMFVDEMGRLQGMPLNSKATEIYRNNIRVHDPDNYAPALMPWIAGPAILFEQDVWK